MLSTENSNWLGVGGVQLSKPKGWTTWKGQAAHSMDVFYGKKAWRVGKGKATGLSADIQACMFSQLFPSPGTAQPQGRSQHC